MEEWLRVPIHGHINEDHVLALTRAIVGMRKKCTHDGILLDVKSRSGDEECVKEILSLCVRTIFAVECVTSDDTTGPALEIARQCDWSMSPPPPTKEEREEARKKAEEKFAANPMLALARLADTVRKLDESIEEDNIPISLGEAPAPVS